VTINDTHCHFFSTELFAALARQRQPPGPPPPRGSLMEAMQEDEHRRLAVAMCDELGWEPPGSAYTLADRWVRELDAHGVARAALIASVPSDETSVAAAVAKHPGRFVGFFMLDPSAGDPVARTKRALGELGLRGICLFPSMHHVPLHDDRVHRIVSVAASHPGAAVFVHCGVLSVGVRKKLGLPSRFDLRLGDPLGVAKLALAFPTVPFIIPHFGAGLFREALMAADTCSNIHLDTSSSNGWMRYTPGLTLDEVFRTALSVVGASRLLFGTDSSFFPRGWQKPVFDAQKAALASLGHTAEDEALIFGGNFDRLFPAPS
jgi:predicted TIM-barrel fold metal-dependent hydrolase